MVLIWGTNYSIVKSAFDGDRSAGVQRRADDDRHAVFLAVMAFIRGRARRGIANRRGSGCSTRRRASRAATGWTLAWLGVVGHFGYQVLFIGGLALTSVANSSLIIAATPVVIAVASALLCDTSELGRCTGQGRRSRLPASTSSSGAELRSVHEALTRRPDDRSSAVLCWAVYTLGAEPSDVSGIRRSASPACRWCSARSCTCR